MNNKIAIVAVGYNRIDSMARLLTSLNKAKYADENVSLIISIDKSDTTNVEDLAEQFVWLHGDKIIDRHLHNLGLKAHMLSLGKWFEKYEALIVLEDDIIVSPYFYSFANKCISKYKGISKIAGISLYSFSVNYQTRLPFVPMHNGHDVYFMNCAMSWGEVWLKDGWMKFFEWYQEHSDFSFSEDIPACLFEWSRNSWLKFHTRYCIETDKFFVFPYVSYTTNCGDKGIHHSGYGYDIAQVAIEYGERSLVLPEIDDEDCVLYDGFFENKAISRWLDINSKELLTDLNGTRNIITKRYLLSSNIFNYKIIKTYDLKYKPIEINILENVPGNNLFLYDTNSIENNSHVFNRNKYYSYYYGLSSLPVFLRNVGLGALIKEFLIYIYLTIKCKFV